MDGKSLLRYLPSGSAFRLFAGKQVDTQRNNDLARKVQKVLVEVRSQSTESIIEDTRQTAPMLADIVRDVVTDLRAGMTTNEIDAALSSKILAHGLLPSMFGVSGFPAASALSVGPALLHAPPSDQVISDGDLLTIQLSASSNFSQASLGITVPVGRQSAGGRHVVNGCRQALENAVEVVRPGIRTGEISHEIERSLNALDLSPVRDFCGYSMGQERMQDPQILCFGPPDRGDRIKVGTILNIYVIAAVGDPSLRIDEDNWTSRTCDGSMAALATAMVLVERDGSTLLTPMPLENI
ncbi:M24 family metallopeptidase [Halovulum sp. GXIMD14793]